MSTSARPVSGLGRLVAATVGFALVAPVALVALPLSVLLAASGPRTRHEFLLGGLAGGFALWWLLRPGAPPEQLLRATAVVVTGVFLGVTVRTAWSFVHRSLLALGVAAAALYVAALASGTTWAEVHWWVQHQAGVAARLVVGRLWQAAAERSGSLATIEQMDDWLIGSARLMADFYPALVAMQVWGGLALATALYQRLAARPRGSPLGRLRDFRFTEHLGWGAALPLIVLLVMKASALKVAAQNMLLVAAVLYGLRGVAVAAFGLQAVGAGGVLLWALAAIIAIVMLPVVLGSAIVLGVVDAGLDLRRRWIPPRTGA